MRRRLFLATHETRSLHSTHRVRVTSPTPGSASSSRTAQQGSRAVARPGANKRENKVKGPLAEQSRHHRALSVSNRAKHVRPPPTALGRVPSMSRPPHRHACPAVPRKKEPHKPPPRPITLPAASWPVYGPGCTNNVAARPLASRPTHPN